MPDDGVVEIPVLLDGAQPNPEERTVEPTDHNAPNSAYSHVKNADDTRQAQHSLSNDAPTDVNMNAIVARSQAHTVDMAGKAFTANQDRRDKIADALMGRALSGAVA